jgi:hypothetical protein
MDAIILIVCFVALAIAAPIWGRDSTDGVDADEYSRRASWLGSTIAPSGPVRSRSR